MRESMDPRENVDAQRMEAAVCKQWSAIVIFLL